MKLKKKNVFVYAAIAAIFIAGIILFRGNAYSASIKADKEASKEAVKRVTVKIKKAETVQASSALQFKATLEAQDEGMASSKAGGKVVQILFESGKQVSQGEPLVKLDDRSIKDSIASAEAQLKVTQAGVNSAENQRASAETTVEKLQTAMETAQASYERTKVLFDQGAVSQVSIENTEAALNNAKADLKTAWNGVVTAQLAIQTAKANLQSAQVGVDNLRHNLEDTVITAPMSGIVYEKSVTLGQYINVGTVVAKINDASMVNAVINVVQSDLKYIKAGQRALVKIEGDDSKAYEGIVKSINAAADSSARSFACKVELENKDGLLKPGTYAVVEITGDQKYEAVTLPINVLMGSSGNYSVFVNENGVARKCSVTLGKMTKDTAEIKSGIKSGDSIICSNLNMLQDGDAITVAEE